MLHLNSDLFLMSNPEAVMVRKNPCDNISKKPLEVPDS